VSHSSSLLYLSLMKDRLNKIRPYFRLLSTFVFILCIYLILEISGFRSQLTVENIRPLFEDNFILGSLLFIGAFTLGNLAQVPGWIFLSASVFALGKVNGYLITTTAALVSACISFYLVRFIGQDGLRKITHPIALKLFKKLDQSPLKINIILRILFQTLPPLNYSLALSGVKFKHYFLGALIGLPLPILIMTLLIDQLLKVTT
jgi:uncharacterized membrane protein YdjX (TVP38/TMEM64 family)